MITSLPLTVDRTEDGPSKIPGDENRALEDIDFNSRSRAEFSDVFVIELTLHL